MTMNSPPAENEWVLPSCMTKGLSSPMRFLRFRRQPRLTLLQSRGDLIAQGRDDLVGQLPAAQGLQHLGLTCSHQCDALRLGYSRRQVIFHPAPAGMSD